MGITLPSTELLATARTSPDPGSLVKNWHAARLLSGSSLTAVFGYLERSFWQRAEASHLISCAVLWLLWFWTICLLPLCEGNVVRRVWKIILHWHHIANAIYLLQIFLLICRINENGLFIIIFVPPLCGPAVFLVDYFFELLLQVAYCSLKPVSVLTSEDHKCFEILL